MDVGTGGPTARAGVSTVALLVAVVGVAVAGGSFGDALRASDGVGTAATVFVSVFVQAVPFLVLGVVVSGLVATFLTPERLRRLLPRNQAVAVGVAGIGGMALPGCECGSVPVARRLMEAGVPRAAALTFLLAAPAVNPVVVVATLVAFAQIPQMALARILASMVTAVVVGWIWIGTGRSEWMIGRMTPLCGTGAGAPGENRVTVFVRVARGDLVTSASYLVLGAAVVAATHVVLPARWTTGLGAVLPTSIAVAVVLAVVLSLCSEADAFVAAAMTMLPLLPRLVFLVVGPVVDLKLVIMYAGVFGRRFTARFVPLVLCVAVVSAVTVGGAVLASAHVPGAW